MPFDSQSEILHTKWIGIKRLQKESKGIKRYHRLRAINVQFTLLLTLCMVFVVVPRGEGEDRQRKRPKWPLIRAKGPLIRGQRPLIQVQGPQIRVQNRKKVNGFAIQGALQLGSIFGSTGRKTRQSVWAMIVPQASSNFHHQQLISFAISSVCTR